MTDLYEQLRQLQESGQDQAKPIPAQEVRRRAARRTRQQSLGGLVAVAVVVALAVGGATKAGDLLGSDQVEGPANPAVTSTAPQTDGSTGARADGSWLSVVPTGFPLRPSISMVESSFDLKGPSASVGSLELAPCGASVWPPVGTIAQRGVTASEPEHFQARQVALFANARDARAALATARDAYLACPDEPDSDGDGYAQVFVSTTPAWGDGALAVQQGQTREGQPAIGVIELRFVRVGNALLLTYESNEAILGINDDPGSANEATAALVDAMCVFAAQPCT